MYSKPIVVVWGIKLQSLPYWLFSNTMGVNRENCLSVTCWYKYVGKEAKPSTDSYEVGTIKTFVNSQVVSRDSA